MKTKTIKSLLLSAVGAVTFSSIAIGTTFALFTSSAETAIEVASGKINVQQQVSITSKTSALYDSNGTYDVDRNGNHYSSQDGWVNGGDAEVLSDGSLSLTKMTPGDKVNFKVQMKNSSNVACKYRFVFEAVDKSSLLASGLEVSINDIVYAGLLSYSTEWTLISPVETPEFGDLITGSIYLPMTRDNVFQNLNTSYALRIEAIQSNAYTTGEASYEVASYLPQSAVLDAEKKASVVYDEGQDSEVAIDLDLSNSTTYQAGQEVILSVNNVDVIENSFVVSGGNNAAAAIDLNLYIDNVKVSDGFEAKITTKVATGLENIKIEYDSNQTVAFADGGTSVELADLDQPGEFYYNSEDGTLVFITNHFSDYIVTASNIQAYNKTSKASYTSLQGAINSASDNDTIVLINNLVLDKQININKSIVINGNDKVVTNNNSVANVYYAFSISDDNEEQEPIHIVLNNLTLNTTGYQVAIMANCDNYSELDVNNVDITCDGECVYANGHVTGNLNNCDFTHQGIYAAGKDEVYYSALLVGYGGVLNVNNSKILSYAHGVATFPSGGSINLNNTDVTVREGDLGEDVIGYAIWSRNEDYPSYPDYCSNSVIMIDSGTVIGAFKITDKYTTGDKDLYAPIINIISGTFDNDPTEYVDEGSTVSLVDNHWVVTKNA